MGEWNGPPLDKGDTVASSLSRDTDVPRFCCLIAGNGTFRVPTDQNSGTGADPAQKTRPRGKILRRESHRIRGGPSRLFRSGQKPVNPFFAVSGFSSLLVVSVYSYSTPSIPPVARPPASAAHFVSAADLCPPT
jgi:hypothetical protein